MSKRVSVLPDVGAIVPSWAVRVGLVVVAAGAALVQFSGFVPGLVVALVLALAAGLWPRTMLGWAFILLVGVSFFWSEPRFDWHLFALIALLHLVHVITSIALWMPWRSAIQASALVRPFGRFVIVQLASQAVALVVVAVSGGAFRFAPWFALVSAVALIALTLVLARPLLREKIQARH